MEHRSEAELEEIVRQITYRPQGRMERFRALPLAERSAAFGLLSPAMRQEILGELSLEESVELLDHLDLRRAHHILDKMRDARRRRRIVSRLKNDLYAKLEHFLQFHPSASMGLVHLNYVLLADTVTVGETAEVIEDYVRTTGKIPAVLVHENGTLTGEVSLGTLVREPNRSALRKYVAPIKTMPYTASREEVLTLCTEKPHRKVAVLDTDGSVLGIVYSDDVIELVGDAPASTLYSFAGVEESEKPFDGMWSKVRHRHRWLILNLATAFLAAGVIAFFEDTLAQVVLLAMYMPVIAGMGGNASTQTLAVMVRGIAVGEISLSNSRSAIVREAGAGLINGLITGVLVALVATFFNQSPLLGLVVGLSVVASLVVAGIAGTVIPLVLKYFGKDPATSATIFITTVTDVLGFFVLLGLATLILL